MNRISPPRICVLKCVRGGSSKKEINIRENKLLVVRLESKGFLKTKRKRSKKFLKRVDKK